MNTYGYRLDSQRSSEIEQCARSVQIQLWKDQVDVAECVNDPLSVLEPGIALDRLGYSIQTVDSLGTCVLQGNTSRVAGMLDRGHRLVRVSREFPIAEMRYTTGHELGHVVLGHSGETIHRDRPIDPYTWNKDPQEREADYFSACFWMPRKHLTQYFKELFLTDTFTLTEQTAFALCATSLDTVTSRVRTGRDLSLILARARNYAGRPVRSLVEAFKVTPTAMAIRLEELKLVAA